MIDGKTIAITRSVEDSREFTELMASNNAKPISLPTIELVSRGEKIVDEFLKSAKEFGPDYSVFMSSKAVKLLFEAAEKDSKLDELRLAVANTVVLAVGPKTKQAVEAQSIRVAHMPKRFSSVGIGEVFTRLNAVGKKVIVPRSGASTPFLANLLEKIGLVVNEVHLYDVRPHSDAPQWNEFGELFSKNSVDGIIFTSASSVRAFFEILKKRLEQKTIVEGLHQTKVVAIGPFTAEELKKFDVENSIAQVHTVPGAVDAIKNIFS